MDPTNSMHWMWDFEAFINELEVNFGPHNPVRDAKKSLTELTIHSHNPTPTLPPMLNPQPHPIANPQPQQKWMDAIVILAPGKLFFGSFFVFINQLIIFFHF